jgi:hypothetical protein
MVSQEKLKIMSKDTGFNSPQNRNEDLNSYIESKKLDILSPKSTPIDPHFSEQYQKLKENKMQVKQVLKSHNMMQPKKSFSKNMRSSNKDLSQTRPSVNNNTSFDFYSASGHMNNTSKKLF